MLKTLSKEGYKYVFKTSRPQDLKTSRPQDLKTSSDKLTSLPILIFFLLSAMLASCGGSGSSSGNGVGNKKDGGNGGGSTRPFCPTSYIRVPANTALGVNDDFCVMQFEAKRDDNGDVVSQAANSPWASITPTNAFDVCEAVRVDEYSGEFALISNPEWMTIARNIENTASNWSGGSVGNGVISQGHTDANPAAPVWISDLNDPWSNTSNDSNQVPGSGWEQKRTFTLSNGSVIWDLAGNVEEWVDWDATNDANFTIGPIDGTASWHDFPSLSGSLTANDVLPANASNNHSRYFGKWHGGTTGIARRGGRYGGFPATKGVFSMLLSSTVAKSNIGFRCVYRP